MKILALAVIILFFGTIGTMAQFQAPTPQPLPSPTAYPTYPPTPTAISTTTYPFAEMDNALATAEYELSQPMQIEAPSEIQFLANAFGFIQYVATHAYELFGVFAPIFQFLMFLTPIALILFVGFAGNLLVSTLYSIISDIYQKIRG